MAHRGRRDLRICSASDLFRPLRLAPGALDIQRLRRVNFTATIRPKMFAPSISCRVHPNAQRTPGSPPLNCRLPTLNSRRYFPAFTLPRQRERESIRVLRCSNCSSSSASSRLLLVLIAPAFTNIKGGTDVTSAAYTIKGVLDTARTYAKANNTYTWVGFYRGGCLTTSASPNPDTPAVGRIVMSIVASKDGTMLYTGNLASS